ncbi:MAG: peptide-N-glycosidase [bacterium]|nr:peptide-N-glycosidase [bacterium]
MKIRLSLFALLGVTSLLIIFQASASAEVGQLRHVVSHNEVKVVTDPSKGSNSYPAWSVFPSSDITYRKVVLWITYACPDSLHCGEWDYIDAIYLRKSGGEGAPLQNIELARMISPYGWRFDSEWSFDWHVDITDFANLLHDSVLIDFIHTGYEKNDDRGWKISLDFVITEGRPSLEVLRMDTLWCGSFPYGDTAKPIENLLSPITFTPAEGAEIARLRIHQTGHGMDDSANCAEFCSKYRQVYFDDSLFAQRQLWRECGDNPLYPQSGTWIFDRANWCPGSVVYPDWYDYQLTNKPSHSVDIAMEPYINPNKPTANWHIYSYLFQCRAPWAEYDVSVEEIIAPSMEDEYSRLNPICAQPTFVMKNQGSETVTSVAVRYGSSLEYSKKYLWTGLLPPQGYVTVTLPGQLPVPGDTSQFSIFLSAPNGHDDEYPEDNHLTSSPLTPPHYTNKIIVVLRTNNDTSHTSYRLTNVNGDLVFERPQGTLAAKTTYRDTFDLEPNCYQFLVSDTGGDGLDFWFNVEGGYGYVRLLDINGRLIKTFGSDFGSNINHWFSVAPGVETIAPDEDLPIVQPFPPRNDGKFEVDLFFDKPTDAFISVVTEDGTKSVFQQDVKGYKEGFLPIDISASPDGVYYLKVSADGETVTRRIRVKRD